MAEDIVQDVFLKLHRIGCDHIEPARAKSYVVQVTVNRCKDYLKSWHYRKTRVKQYFTERPYNDMNELIEEEERSIIGEAVLNLPVKYREIVVLYYFDDQTTAMISETLHTPTGTVKTRLAKARSLLKQQLHEDQWEVLNVEK